MQQSGDARKGRVLWLVGYRFTNLHFLFSMASVVCAKKKTFRARGGYPAQIRLNVSPKPQLLCFVQGLVTPSLQILRSRE